MMSESSIQSQVVTLSAKLGMRLWRNNVGVLLDKRGVPVRFGLANDSAKLNDQIKSADLIGWREVVITPDMVGQTIAQFISVECKKERWNGKIDAHVQAQIIWGRMVGTDGGLAMIIDEPLALAVLAAERAAFGIAHSGVITK